MMKAGCSGRSFGCLPVYMAMHPLCSELENFTDLRRSVDLARIARHPGRRHRLPRDLVEMLGADADTVQAPRHAEVSDELVQHIAGVLAGLPHGGCDQRLAFGIVLIVLLPGL